MNTFNQTTSNTNAGINSSAYGFGMCTNEEITVTGERLRKAGRIVNGKSIKEALGVNVSEERCQEVWSKYFASLPREERKILADESSPKSKDIVDLMVLTEELASGIEAKLANVKLEVDARLETIEGEVGAVSELTSSIRVDLTGMKSTISSMRNEISQVNHQLKLISSAIASQINAGRQEKNYRDIVASRDDLNEIPDWLDDVDCIGVVHELLKHSVRQVDVASVTGTYQGLISKINNGEHVDKSAFKDFDRKRTAVLLKLKGYANQRIAELLNTKAEEVKLWFYESSEGRAIASKSKNYFRASSDQFDASAEAVLIGDRLVVLTGSLARKGLTNSAQGTHADNLRKLLIDAKVLIEKEDYLIFSEHYAFESSSAAASVVLGRQSSGPENWISPEGRSLRSIEMGD